MSTQIDLTRFENQIALIIPAYEPDEQLPELIRVIRQDYKGHILIINDGSGHDYDTYYDQVKELGCDVFTHYRNMGKGRALKNSFNYALSHYPGLLGVVTADSDGQHTPTDIYRCMEMLYDNQDSLVLGCRNFTGDNVPKKSKVGNNFMNVAANLLCGVKVSDTQTGLRGIPAKFMAYLMDVKGERFEFETWMLIEAKDKFPFKEVSIDTVYDSVDNHKTHFNAIKDSWKIVKILLEVFAKFTFSSLSSSVIDIALFTVFCNIFISIPTYYILISTVLARLISASYNYIINYKIVFNSNQKHGKALGRYIILAIIQMALSGVFVTGLVSLLPMIHHTLIKVVVDIILFMISFVIQRKFVF